MRLRLISLAYLLTLSLASVTLGEAQSRVQQTLTVNEVPELRGYLGQRWEANRLGSLHQFDIDHYTRLVEQRTHRDWWWAGEQDGKWLESAVLSSANTDRALRTRAKAVLDRLIASQESSGYLGVTPSDARTAEKPLRGMDPYEDYFRLHALITAYEQWRDEQALDAARRFGDYLVRYIGPGKAEFWPSKLRPPENRGKTLQGESDIAGHAVHYGWEGTLLIDPMLRLALATGDRRYTDWSKWVVDNLDKWSGWDSYSKLDQVADGELGVDALQPYVHSHTFHMNFLGFLRLYEITGDESYLRKVAGAWDDIAKRQMYITGGVSVGEHYEAGKLRPLTGHVVETCATMSWLQVTQYLLELTGDVKYADAMEKLIWNHVFASQAIDGDCYRYHTPPNGEKPQGYFHGPDCCTSSGQRLVSLLPTFLYGKDERGLFVNQYGASTVDATLGDGRTIRVRQDTAYPESTDVSLTIEAAPAEAAVIRLRMPRWCASPEVELNGRAVNGAVPGAYLTIKRSWQSGDQLHVSFPMEPHWVQSDATWKTEIRRLPGGEIMHEPAANATQPWALVRGPVVYAVDTLWWNNPNIPAPADAGGDLGAMPDDTQLVEVPAPEGLIGPAFRAPFFTSSGEPVTTLLVPFTNIGHWYRAGQPKPNQHAVASSYAVWVQSHNSPEFKESVEAARQQADRLTRAVDYVLIGNPESEKSHNVAGGESGGFNDKTYRHGRDFSYEMRMPPERPGRLVVTYWGGDAGREFDVMANDRVLATQRLSGDRPGEFFEASYEVPAELIAGKTDAFGQKIDKIKIRFRSLNEDLAGGVFGIRVE
ncbi:MAG: glycoside hydrolase family 127 protein [Planctomycetales bacterium]|nr:glycoside hydrolase family 127 protein [Planctomycetales bacterium]